MQRAALLIGLLLLATLQAHALTLVDLRGVQFQSGRPRLGSLLEDSLTLPSAKAWENIDQAVDTLRRFPDLKVRIVGYTDDRECASAEACDELSQRRAFLVYRWMTAHGAPSSQITAVVGLGNRPLDSNETETGRQRNRRVEITQFPDP